MSITLVIYQDQSGNAPFEKWLSNIKDKKTEMIIRSRLRRIEESGNLGDHKSLKDGVFEFRIHYGAGYRIYFGKIDSDTILLLGGSDKRSQKQDIRKAKTHWKEHNSSG